MSTPCPNSDDGTRVIARALEHTSLLPMPVVWTLLGLLRGEGNLGQAEALLSRVHERVPAARMLEERARNAYLAGNLILARRVLEERAALAPSATSRAAVARVMIDLGELDAARSISEQLMVERPDLLTTTDLAAAVAVARGEGEIARAIYFTQVDERPDRPAPLFALGNLAIDDGDHAAASEFLRRGLAASGTPSPGATRAASALARRLGEDDTAIRLDAEAAALDAARRASSIATITAALSEAGLDDAEPPPLPQPAPPPTRPARRADAVPKQASPEAVAALQELFGHAAFRPGQEPIVAAVLAGRDVLAILPTGAGKSLTFQLPAMLLPGLTIVVSPLIALMKDQFDALPETVRRRAAILTSALEAADTRHTLAQLRAGELKLLYVAPERLRQRALRRALSGVAVSRLVIDEAHCISLWGHDFRPDYLAIPDILAVLGEPPVLALTATATDDMADSIAETLGRTLEYVRTSVYRPNLRYEVELVETREDKARLLVDICQRERGPGIVYVSSRDDADAVARNLRSRGIRAVPYHAGLPPEERSRNQDDFMAGRAQVIAATVAFGMGIDKPDIRFIVHLSPSRSVGAYAQESGRAGRDGLPSRCALLVSRSDLQRLPGAAQRDLIQLPDLRRLFKAIQDRAIGRWAILDPRALDALLLSAPDSLDTREQQRTEIRARVGISLLARAGFLTIAEDAPRSVTIRVGERLGESIAGLPDPQRIRWQQLVEWLGARLRPNTSVTIDTAPACAALEMSPAELVDVIAAVPELTPRDGAPGLCLHIPMHSEIDNRAAASALTALVTASADAATERASAIAAYARGKGCRHASLAAHFGETLPPCGTQCDRCAPEPTAALTPERSQAARSRATADDARAVLQAVQTLPFPMGKAGLTKLLSGSAESTVRADRSPSYGVLADLRRSAIEGLIDLLVDRDVLFRDLESPYRIITLGERAGGESAPDLDGLFAPTPAMRSPAAAKPTRASVEPMEDETQARLDRLTAWRRERATADGVPAYVVASNDTLLELANSAARTLDDLQRIRGIGPSRVERYGHDLLALLNPGTGDEA